MSKTSPRTFVKPQPAKTSDRAAVYAHTKRGRGYRIVRVSGFMSYPEAHEVYSRLEAYNARGPLSVLHTAGKMKGERLTPKGFISTAGMADDAALSAGGGPVLWLGVRYEDSPDVQGAPRVTAVPRTREARAARAKVRAL